MAMALSGLGHFQRQCVCAQSCLTVAHRLLCPGDFPGKNTGVGCHFLLSTQEQNPHLIHLLMSQQAYSLPLSHWGAPSKGQHLPITYQKFNLVDSTWKAGTLLWDALSYPPTYRNQRQMFTHHQGHTFKPRPKVTSSGVRPAKLLNGQEGQTLQMDISIYSLYKF